MKGTTIVVLGLVACFAAQAKASDSGAWLAPGGKLYFGAAPPPGSTAIHDLHQFASARRDTAFVRSDAAHQPEDGSAFAVAPASSSIAAPPPSTRNPKPVVVASPLVEAPQWRERGPCREPLVRRFHTAIDVVRGQQIVSGTLEPAGKDAIKDVRVCAGGECTEVVDDRELSAGRPAPFSIRVPHIRAVDLAIECSSLAQAGEDNRF